MIIIVSVSTIFILLNILLSLYLNVNWIVLGDIPVSYTHLDVYKRQSVPSASI